MGSGRMAAWATSLIALAILSLAWIPKAEATSFARADGTYGASCGQYNCVALLYQDLGISSAQGFGSFNDGASSAFAFSNAGLAAGELKASAAATGASLWYSAQRDCPR
jgi:hypothetical protein